jgi:DNA-binding NarL/FixJ family response regulator
MSFKIFVSDNQAVFRAGVARLLAIEDDVRLMGQCDDLARLEKALETSTRALFIFASSLAAEIPRLIDKASVGDNRLVAVLEITESPQLYLKSGIPGILYRDVSHAELVRCMHTVARGSRYVQQRTKGSSPSIEADLVGETARQRLTAKELKIVSLVVQGFKNKDIAEELNNSEQVIKNCLRSIFDKTGVSGRLELALFTIHHRILFDAAEFAYRAGNVSGIAENRVA